MPSYIFIENTTFAQLIHLLKDLLHKVNDDDKKINTVFGYSNHKIFIQHLYALNYLRNIVAHHENLIGRYCYKPIEKKIPCANNDILNNGLNAYKKSKKEIFKALYVNPNNPILNNIIEYTDSVDTFYPYYCLLEHYIYILKLHQDSKLALAVDHFRYILFTMISIVDQKTQIVADQLGIADKSWIIPPSFFVLPKSTLNDDEVKFIKFALPYQLLNNKNTKQHIVMLVSQLKGVSINPARIIEINNKTHHKDVEPFDILKAHSFCLERHFRLYIDSENILSVHQKLI